MYGPSWIPSTGASLKDASSDWNAHSVLKNKIVEGANYAECGPYFGRVEVCNDDYTKNGWLGIASVRVSQGKHIVQAVVKLNDWYLAYPGEYDSPEWREYVICQEVGHTFGLGHQDEIFDNENLGTCMDYTDDTDGTDNDKDNRSPNDHDREMLDEIYAHLTPTDSTEPEETTEEGGKGKGGGRGKPAKAGDAGAIDLNDPSQWGQAIRQDARGQNIVFERNLANGQVLITHVLWAN